MRNPRRLLALRYRLILAFMAVICLSSGGCGDEGHRAITRVTDALLTHDPKVVAQWKTLNAILDKESPATVVEAISQLYMSSNISVRRRAAAALGYYAQAFNEQKEVSEAVMPVARRLLADADDETARCALMAFCNRRSAADASLIAARMRTAADDRLIEMGATAMAGWQAWDLLYDEIRRTVADMACAGNECRAKSRLLALLKGIAPGIENAPPIWGTTLARLISVSGVGRRAILCLKRMPGFDAASVLHEECGNAKTLESRVALAAAAIVLKADEAHARERLIECAHHAVDRWARGEAVSDELGMINGWLAFAAASCSDADLLRKMWSIYGRLPLLAKAHLLEDICEEFLNNRDIMIQFLCHDIPREELLDLLRQSDTMREKILATLLGYALREEDAKGDSKVLLQLIRPLMVQRD
jgi:hypothetical protein